MRKRGLAFQYESRALPYRIEAIYTPDFILPSCMVETKGLFSPEDRRKMLAVKACHPDADIRLCFQNAKAKRVKRKECKVLQAQWNRYLEQRARNFEVERERRERERLRRQREEYRRRLELRGRSLTY